MRSKRSEISNLLAVLQKAGFFKGRRKGIYVLLILALLTLYFKTGLKTELSGNNEYTVKEVIDGDTVILDEIDTHVRYLEIDTPEILHENSPGDPLAEGAKNLNKNLVLGKKVKLEFDEEKYDDYGRMLAYVYVDGVFVNQEIVRNGLARVLIIKPNDKYASMIYEAEEQAKRERRGIWGDLSKLDPPSENANFLVKPSQVSRYVGQRVVVRGKITDFRKSKKVIVLNMENDLDIVIFPDSWENFKFFGIAPEKYYVGEPVEAIGRVKMYKSKPNIIISHPISIRVLR